MGRKIASKPSRQGGRAAGRIVLACVAVSCLWGCSPTDIPGPDAGLDDIVDRLVLPAIDPPGAPSHLQITSRLRRPPEYDVRWVMSNDRVLDHFIVYRATSSITEDNRAAAVVATVPGELRSSVVQILPDTGVQFFRVSAVDMDGLESSLSAEFAVDTTSRIAFRSDKSIDNRYELFTTIPDGREPAPVSGVVLPGRVVAEGYAWSPDARRLAWVADTDTAGVNELFVGAADGALPPVKVSGALVPDADVVAFAWSPDATSLAFIADRESDEVYDVYVARAGGQYPPAKISGTMIRREGMRSGVMEFAWSPDGTRIAFTADLRTQQVPELYVVSVDDTDEPVTISGAVAGTGPEVRGVVSFAWSPDSSLIAYLADLDQPGLPELYTVAGQGGSSTKISGAMIQGASIAEFVWAPASDQVAFVTDRDTVGTRELFTAPSHGGSISKISGVITSGGCVQKGVLWARDASRVAFRADAELQGIIALYTVAPSGGLVARASGTLQAGLTVYDDFAWSPACTLLAARMDASLKRNIELLAMDPLGIATPFVTQSLVPGRNVQAFTWSADGTGLAYIADQDLPGQFEAYVVPAAGEVPSVKASGAMPLGGNVLDVAWSPIGN